jgi:hypothetical protein
MAVSGPLDLEIRDPVVVQVNGQAFTNSFVCVGVNDSSLRRLRHG